MLHIGDIEIAVVSDGIVHVDAGGPFGLTPRALYHTILEPDSNNLIPMTLHCLLVRHAGKTIVVDTGLGTKLSPKQQQTWSLVRPHGGLLDGLARLGVKPEGVDLVIDTHLHADHCAGNTAWLEEGVSVRPVFPNAQYVTQSREYDDAMRPNERTRATYFPVNYQPLVESGQMRLLHGDTEIVPGIHGVVTRGHTPAHMAILFQSGGQQALFVADLASYAVHFERIAWMTAYDVEPLETLESKRRWTKWALETNALILFQHDPKIMAGHLTEAGDRRRIEPVAVEVA
ncbi:MAG TPA: MBL fold metallo-hydrolase [Aggregatilineales bacterium]|nr:MBL fold metallo-hydrolase [Aggregatilineales bacterium]